ncbi:MAG TPA: flagellar export protein FliJ [Candidatus Binatia bacterium]|jgi:flagellar export protein FliJ
MAPFKFKLSSVLRYRERKREDKRLELRALEQAKENLLAQIEHLEESIAQQRRQMDGQAGQFLSVAELKLAADFSQKVADRIRERRSVLAIVEKKAADKRNDLLEANRDVKSLEQLRGRLSERHRVEETRAEQKLIDEVGQRIGSSRREAE